MDIAAWLRGLGLGQYERAFRDNAVDGEILPRLTAEDLKELGVIAVGHRRKLLDAIGALGSGPEPKQTAERPAIASAPQVEDGERRQVIVLFADIAGYTALSHELDAEEIHALLGCFFERIDRIVEDHGGRVDKHIGDCVMAVFGAPVAHGDDAERAVRAALAARDAAPALSADIGRSIQFHIGIAAGQVVASSGGSSSHREYTVTGESVNLASRLTDAAGAAEILISDAVQRTLASRIECEDAGALTVAGFAAPVQAWRLHDLRSSRIRAPLVGRRAELHQFRAVLTACLETGRGQAIRLRGEAGIGKTRLLEAFQEMARDAGFRCHSGLVLDFGAGTGRDAIRALVRDLLSLRTGSDAAEASTAAIAAVAEGLVPAESSVFLNDLLDLPQPPELRALYDAMDNPARIRGKRETVAAMIERASASAPRLIAIEDVHWADPLTLAHLARLTSAVSVCPAILVMNTRTEGDPLGPAWRAEAGTPLLSIDLGPLHPDEARTLAAGFVEASTVFAESCLERAAGNPLFLEQLLRHSEEKAGTGVPGSVQSLVQARLDGMAPEDRGALQAASVLGQRFSRDALANLLGVSDYAPERLATFGMARPFGEEFLFAHALVRDAIYDSLLKSRRRQLHRRAAEWFAGRDASLRAEHLDRAGDPEAPRAYLDAAQSQAAAYRLEAALRMVDRGLKLAATAADRFALNSARGGILHDLGRMPDALVAYQDALGAASDEAERCKAWIGLASVKRVTDDLDGAFADLDRAETAAVANGFVLEEARLRFLRGNLHFPRGNIEACLREHGRSLELARLAGAPVQEAEALGGIGDAEYVRGRMISAHDRLHACVELARDLGLRRIEVANLAQITHCMLYFRPLPDALAAALDAVEAAVKVGHLRAEMNARAAACFALSALADGDACREQGARIQDLARRLGARRFEAVPLRPLGRVALAEGRRADAVDLLRRAVALSRETGVTFEGARAMASLALALDQPDERRKALADGEAIIRAGCVGHNHLWFYPDAIETSLELREFDEVERYAGALEEYTRPEPLLWSEFFIARGRALAAVGRVGRTAALNAELGRLRDMAERFGFRVALPAIEAARDSL